MNASDSTLGATPPESAADNVPPAPPRTISSMELLQGGRELLIEHHGEVYRLRLTRNDKLILQK